MKQIQTSHTASVFKTTEFWLAMIFLAGSIFFFTRPAEKTPIQESPEQIQRLVASPTPQPILKSQQIEQPAQQKSISVKVKSGDTFWQLAQKHCGSHRYAESIAASNGYSNVHKLREGATIQIICTLK
ncbi:LysM peptidoglycan-binding domain-containing protein [Candidatus Woesebacteria bacterium]|nr:LysM peptidoglycan-binding domain-containing protein [Candidatus Woesebacteria bacterium]